MVEIPRQHQHHDDEACQRQMGGDEASDGVIASCSLVVGAEPFPVVALEEETDPQEGVQQPGDNDRVPQ